MERNKKMTRSVREIGEPIRVFDAHDERDEAEFVASQVQKLLQEGFISSFAEVGVLFRTNLQSRVLEESFCRHRIPHRVVGAVRFYERKEVKDVVAFLRLLCNNHDTASVERILNVPPRGIGPQTRRQIQAYAQSYNCSILEAIRDLSTMDLFMNCSHQSAVNDKGEDQDSEVRIVTDKSNATSAKFMTKYKRLPLRKREALEKLHDNIQELQHSVSACTPAELIKMVISKLNLEEFFQSQDNGHDRWANILELQAAAGRFLDKGKDELGAFLEMSALVSDRFEPSAVGQASLVTMHASKGLEFKVVMCVGMEEGTFPHHRSLQDTLQLHEERRLAFVAITRARDLLYLTWRRTVPSATSLQTAKVLQAYFHFF